MSNMPPADRQNMIQTAKTKIESGSGHPGVVPMGKVLPLKSRENRTFPRFHGIQKMRVPEEGVEPTRGVIPGRF